MLTNAASIGIKPYDLTIYRSCIEFGFGFRNTGRINRFEGVLLMSYIGYTGYLVSGILFIGDVEHQARTSERTGSNVRLTNKV